MAVEPAHPDLSQIMPQIEKLSPAEKTELYQVLSMQVAKGSHQPDPYEPLQPGWAQELIVSIADDFDAPLPEMKDYME